MSALKIANQDSLFFKGRDDVIVNSELFRELSTYLHNLCNDLDNTGYRKAVIEGNTRGKYKKRDCFTNRVTTLRRHIIQLREYNNHVLLEIIFNWNIYEHNTDVPIYRYFKYKGSLYYYQSQFTNSYGEMLPALFIQMQDLPEGVIDTIVTLISVCKSLNTTKKSLADIGEFLGVGSHFVRVAGM